MADQPLEPDARPPLPYARQWVDEADVAAVAEAVKGDWLTQGPLVERFEDALRQACGAKHAIAVCNGTAALTLACLAADLGANDEGITSSLSFMASASCLVYGGATPRFADILPERWTVDPTAVEGLVGDRTRALVGVDFAGLPCELDQLRAIADRHDLVVIQDACHSLGARYRGEAIAATGCADMVCLSFHPVKHITTGEGGAVLSDAATLAKRLRRLRHHGITHEPQQLKRCDGPWYYEVHELGFNARITDMQCALGLSQLRRLDHFLARRRALAVRYRQGLAGFAPELKCQAETADTDHAYHLFVIHLDPARYDRKQVFETLLSRNIRCQVHYLPIHLLPYFQRRFGTAEGDCPQAEYYYRGCLSLPLFPAMQDADVDRVIDELSRALR